MIKKIRKKCKPFKIEARTRRKYITAGFKNGTAPDGNAFRDAGQP
jgi:hypothetical protein